MNDWFRKYRSRENLTGERWTINLPWEVDEPEVYFEDGQLDIRWEEIPDDVIGHKYHRVIPVPPSVNRINHDFNYKTKQITVNFR